VHEGLLDVFGEKGRYVSRFVTYRCITDGFVDAISNIITHHAEDGSGVGSAIIAGMSSIHLMIIP
jgi:hexokinase